MTGDADLAGDESTLDFSRYRTRRIRERLLVLLDAIVAGIERRDLNAVGDVLDDSDACRYFPAGVREEALQIAALPPQAFRAPMRLYRYYHTLSQLGDEPMEGTSDPDQLQMPLYPRVSRSAKTTPAPVWKANS